MSGSRTHSGDASGEAATRTPEPGAIESAELEATYTPDPGTPVEQLDALGRPDSGLEPTHTPEPARSPSTSRASAGGSWSDDPAPALHVGRILENRYLVGERIGMGGMASVHHSIDTRLDRAVAVKILHPHIAENEDARTRLGREAKAIAQLKHEGVIEVYDFDISDPECTWLVTELIEGCSLRQAIDRAPKPLPEVATMIVTEIVRALKVAHDAGIVHRDVKPDNVLIGRDGRPKLSDFGIAQIISEERMTLTGNLVGSPSYMSPEQAEGRRIDHRTDLFSAGIVLYKLVTGRAPFTGQNAIETLRRVAATEYTDPAELEPDCPAPIAGIIRKALSAEIGDRYQTAQEMLNDLQAVLHDAGLSAIYFELPRYFSDGEVYQLELQPRMAQTLAGRGRALIDAGDEPRGLDCLNRAMTLGGVDSDSTYDLVRVLSRRRESTRLRKSLLAVAASLGVVAIIAGGLIASGPSGSANDADQPGALEPAPSAAARVTPSIPAPALIPPAKPSGRNPEPLAATEPAAAAPAPAAPAVAAPGPGTPTAAPATPTTNASKAPVRSRSRPPPSRRRRRAPTKAKVVTPPPAPPPALADKGVLKIGTRRWVDVYVDGVRLGRAPDRSQYRLPAGTHRLKAVNPHCNPVEKVVTISSNQTTREWIELVCP